MKKQNKEKNCHSEQDILRSLEKINKKYGAVLRKLGKEKYSIKKNELENIIC